MVLAIAWPDGPLSSSSGMQWCWVGVSEYMSVWERISCDGWWEFVHRVYIYILDGWHDFILLWFKWLSDVMCSAFWEGQNHSNELSIEKY